MRFLLLLLLLVSHLREPCLTQGYKYLQWDMSWVGVSPGGAFVGGGGGDGGGWTEVSMVSVSVG